MWHAHAWSLPLLINETMRQTAAAKKTAGNLIKFKLRDDRLISGKMFQLIHSKDNLEMRDGKSGVEDVFALLIALT